MSEEEELEEEETETFKCPSCGRPQREFLYHPSRRGWVKCLSCGKYVRKKLIPQKFVRVVQSLKEIEPEEAEEEEELEGRGRVPFRRPRPAYMILRQILEEFGVKPEARRIIIGRCKRIGELHPSEVERMLLDLDSGLKRKEASYVAEEYYYALQSEREEAEETYGRTVYPRTWGEEGYSTTTYGWSRSRTSTSFLPPAREYGARRPWEPQRGFLTEDRLLEILEERDRRFEERLRQQKIEDTLTNLMKQVISLSNEIKNIKENPPSAIPPNVVTREELEKQRADAYVKMLERQIETMEKTLEKYEELIRNTEEKYREELKELQKTYREELKDLREKYEKARESARSIQSYRDDTIRFTADVTKEIADVLKDKEPVKTITQTLVKLAEKGETSTAQPPKEKVGEQTITEQLPPELIEE